MTPQLVTPRLFLEAGAVQLLPAVLAELGVARPLLLSDQGLVHCGAVARLRTVLSGIDAVWFEDVPENPTYAGVDRASALYRASGCDGVVALGGGSVIDTAKLVAVLAGHAGNAAEYVGFSERVTAAVAPLVVLPTTAGTGSEASPDAGIHPDAHSVSSGITSWHVVPRTAICDPELLLTLPSRLTAATGLDALSHCIEGYLATPASPLADALALDGIARIRQWLPVAVADGTDLVARREMMLGAFAGGIAIGKGLGPAHAIAISCGDQGLHHGVLSALGLVASMDAMATRVPERMARIEAAMGAPVADSVRRMLRDFHLPQTLSALGYVAADWSALAQAAATSHFNLSSPWRPAPADYAAMLEHIA